MPYREWLRKLLGDAERQQDELKRLKSRSDELLGEASKQDRRKEARPVTIERRKRPVQKR